MGWSQILMIGVAGALGTWLRLGLGQWVQTITGTGFPWGTTVVNTLGCFLYGLIWVWLQDGKTTPWTSLPLQLILLTGFLGALTTFSTYLFETVQLFRLGQPAMAFANFVVQNALGFGFLWLGFLVARRVFA